MIAPVQVVSSGEGGATGGQTGLVGVTLDEKAGDGGEVGLVLGVGGHLALLLLGAVDVGHVR